MTATQSNTRIASHDIKVNFPGIYPAMYALKESVAHVDLESDLLELVNIRAAQLNGCAFCLQLHLKRARTIGMVEEKLELALVWEEAGIFTERERAALAWTEAVTLIARDHVPDEAYEAAREVFSENELVALTTNIAIANVWNRICGTFRYPPEL